MHANPARRNGHNKHAPILLLAIRPSSVPYTTLCEYYYYIICPDSVPSLAVGFVSFRQAYHGTLAYKHWVRAVQKWNHAGFRVKRSKCVSNLAFALQLFCNVLHAWYLRLRFRLLQGQHLRWRVSAAVGASIQTAHVGAYVVVHLREKLGLGIFQTAFILGF